MTLAVHPLAHLPGIASLRYRELPHITAIYFVVHSSDAIIYIGRARDLAQRFPSHHRRTQLIRPDTAIVWFPVVENASERQLAALERICINKYRPELNDTPIERPVVVDVRPFVERQRQQGERLNTLLDECKDTEAQIVATEDTIEQQLVAATNWLRRYRQGLNKVLSERQQQQAQITAVLSQMKAERKQFLPLVRKALEEAP